MSEAEQRPRDERSPEEQVYDAALVLPLGQTVGPRNATLDPAAAPGFPVSRPIVRSPPMVNESGRSGDSGSLTATTIEPWTSPAKPQTGKRPNRLRRAFGWLTGAIRTAFCVVSLVGLLAFLAAIPVLQFVSLGYLLQVAGRLAGGATIRESLHALPQSGRVGLAVLALWLASLPTQLLVHWESVAVILNSDSMTPTILRVSALACAVLTLAYLMWAWVRGGRLTQYVWPEPQRLIRQGWRRSTWSSAADRLWDFTRSFEVLRLFWLGLRGGVGTLVWLVPAMLIIAANRNGQTGLAGLVGGLSLLALGIAMLYLPMLQVNFAAENRLRGLFRIGRVREDFRRAPWAWLAAMVIGLVLAPIPLYLLKVEVIAQEAVWLLCLVFVAFMLPARMAAGLAIRRARRKDAVPSGKWASFSRMAVRVMMLLVVATYLLFVYLSQYTSWTGLETWIQQHAILVPFPFVGV